MFNYISIRRIEQDLCALAQFGASEQGGVTRLPFTPADALARRYIADTMKEIGLDVTIDAVGSIIGRLQGECPDLPSLAIGSHYDSVVNGGTLDGILGVVGALEIARVIKEHGLKHRNTIEIIAFNDEEGVRFGGGFLGSRAITGDISHDELFSMSDGNGVTMASEMINAGFHPNKIKTALRKPQDFLGFLELHIEQGPVLDAEKLDIGIVTAIVGMQRYFIEIVGRADHAGTTPMDMRLDALSSASKVIAQIDSLATAFDPCAVATVGYLRVEPCAINIVPANVTFSIDIRAKDVCNIHRVLEKIISLLEQECVGLKFNITKAISAKPAEMSKEIQAIIEKQAIRQGLSYRKILSGAGHDALIMANMVDTAMIFIPSRNGRSHSPEEFSDSSHILQGVQLLFNTVAQLVEIER